MTTFPTVHMNGTSRKELMAQYTGAMSAVRDAIEVLRQTVPNGRDYYPQGPDAILEASKAHRARVARLQATHDELEEIALAIHG